MEKLKDEISAGRIYVNNDEGLSLRQIVENNIELFENSHKISRKETLQRGCNFYCTDFLLGVPKKRIACKHQNCPYGKIDKEIRADFVARDCYNCEKFDKVCETGEICKNCNFRKAKKKSASKSKHIKQFKYCYNCAEASISSAKVKFNICPHKECPYHELDNIENYDEYCEKSTSELLKILK